MKRILIYEGVIEQIDRLVEINNSMRSLSPDDPEYWDRKDVVAVAVIKWLDELERREKPAEKDAVLQEVRADA